MADKRMFSKKMINSDAFLEMPLTAQGLYFHMVMSADDDGFIDSPKRIMREVGAKPRDLEFLIKKRYILAFPSGIMLIKHWFLHNSIAKDRYTPTVYTEERAAVVLKCGKQYLDCKRDDDKSYTECKQNDTKTKADCVQARFEIQEMEEERQEENDEDICSPLKKTCNATSGLDEFYESIWKLYPLKKGKGKVSKSKKKVLQKIGYEHIKRCTERYISEIRSSGKEEYMMHGSTFFNSGYVDYLDENYKTEKMEKVLKTEAEEDRFASLKSEIRSELETCGVIDGQSLDLGNATDDQIKYLQDCGVL